MHAARVPYRSPRSLAGLGCPRPQLGALAGSSKKRNWDAFNTAFPGTTVNSSGNYVLPAKFAGVVINQGQLDDLSGTWYGATYHPDGDQAGWQQKFDAALKSIGAYNTYYGVQAPSPTPTPTPSPTPTPTPSPSPGTITLGTTIIGYATNADNAPLYAGSDGRVYFKTTTGWGVYSGPINSGPSTPTPAPTPLPVPTPAPGTAVQTVPPDQTAALIKQLMDQGASQQQAYTAALQNLAAQGIQSTPQVQQQVANDVASASSPSQANVMILAGGVVAVILLGIVLSRKKRR